MNRIGLVALAALVLAGCTVAPTEEPDGGLAAYEESVGEMVDLLDQLQALVPGEWTNTEFGARPCALPGGGSGAQGGIQRLGPAVEAGTERATAEQMITILADAGYEATMGERPIENGVVILGGYPASGSDENGIGINFGVSPNGSTLDSMTRCVPGDSNEINQQR